jgi:hypothetical protein
MSEYCTSNRRMGKLSMVFVAVWNEVETEDELAFFRHSHMFVWFFIQ